MNKKIKAEELERALKDLLEEESDRVQKSVDKVTKKTKKRAKEKVEDLSPYNPYGKKNKHYKDDWRTRTFKDRVQQHVVISNRQYQLTHLLENGHFIFNQNGGAYGRTRNFPHIRPTQDMVDDFYIDELEKELKKF